MDHYFEEEEFNTQFNGHTLRRIAAQAKPHWRGVAGFVVLIALVSLNDSVFTYLSKLIIDEGILAGDRARLNQLFIIYGSLALVQAAAIFGFIYLAGQLGERIQYELRRKMFNHLQSLSLSYYSKTPIGWIMSRVTSDSARISELITWGLIDSSWAVFNLSTALIFMIWINWQLALIMAVVMPAIVIIASIFKRQILVQFRRARKLNSKLTGAYNENITGVRVVKALTREEKNLEEFDGQATSLYHAAFRAAWLSALFLPIVQLVGAVGLGAIVWYGGWQIEIGAMSIGSLQAFMGYLTFMLFPIQELARVYAEMQNSIASAERIFSLIDAEPEVVDRSYAFDPQTVKGDIHFDHVDFFYDEKKPVLLDFNLRVKQGETIALVGPTGGGKSTIVNLICRFYEPQRGVIRIGGTDYTSFTLESIQSRIGMVLQSPHLFSGAIRDNIRYGRLDATDAEIEAAAQLAHAHEFITAMPKGYDEEVGEGGNLLSVGQKQLISLARAVLSRPEIFIMDEATSSVDTLTEALIQQGMETLMHGRTSFIIAHRLSTIKKADRILVIEGGRITESGSHQELIRQQGHYYSLYTKQFQAEAQHEIDQLFEAKPQPTAEVR
ncbi:MAG TPA: ABC transporter ATP-binding protein [Anaerolineae bacterium]|nr:ABC transporter ATP-binding protein [Anaerolineae bacterium]HRV91625.1 ABC transporter ATP-binding protein [Anaerolineae bacterium]